MAATHEVLNQPTPLEDINLFQANQALRDALTQFDAQVIYVAPPEMSLTPEFKKELEASGWV